jgi:hypothetical protein
MKVIENTETVTEGYFAILNFVTQGRAVILLE